MSGENKKGYNNPDSWDKFEKNTTRIINTERSEIEDIEVESVEPEIINPNEESVLDDDTLLDGNYDEVLQLNEYNGNVLPQSKGNTGIVVAEYEDINVVSISEKHKALAKNFVGKITKFILDFKDVSLTEDHKKYIKQVGQLQLSHLEDLLTLVDINKQMLNNIIHRVNATQAEDYVIINTYSSLTNQHLKLIKELENKYKSIPSVLKRMRAEIICNQELGEGDNGINNNEEENGLITKDYGETQFNNSKHMMRHILEKIREEEKKD